MTRRLTAIGRNLQSRLRHFFDSPLEADATPLELCQAVLDDVERHVQPLGRGRRTFPYTRLLVRVSHPGPGRAAVEAAFERFEVRVRERLAELRCDAPASLEVRMTWPKKPPAEWGAGQMFAVEYAREAEPAAVPLTDPAAPPPTLSVTVVKGATVDPAYAFTQPVVAIGRSADPAGEPEGTRRNRVAFLDTVDGVTETVGRAHARLRFDSVTREYRLFDEGSSNGTSILRDGATIAVRPRDPRGVRVRSGDEVMVGRAVLRLEITD